MKSIEEKTMLRVATLETEVEQLRLKVEKHDAVIKFIDPGIDRIEASLFQFFEIYRQAGCRFDHLDFRFEENSRRFDRIEVELRTLSENVDQRFEAIDQRFDSIEATLAQVLEAVRPSSAGGASVN